MPEVSEPGRKQNGYQTLRHSHSEQYIYIILYIYIKLYPSLYICFLCFIFKIVHFRHVGQQKTSLRKAPEYRPAS